MARNGPQKPLSTHVEKFVKRQLEILHECRRWMKAKDPVEALHDLRVASRRLRALGDVFQDLLTEDTREAAEKRLRHVTRSAREVRDWDVARELLRARCAGTADPAEQKALRHLLKWAAERRKRALAPHGKRGASLDLDSLDDLVETELEQVSKRMPPAAERERLARAVLERLVAQVARELPPPGGKENPRALHRARVELKKLRYALELLSPALGGGYENLHEAAARVQELLGKHHDLVVLGELIKERSLDLAEADRDAVVPALRSLAREIAKDRRAVFRQFMTSGFGADSIGAPLMPPFRESGAARAVM